MYLFVSLCHQKRSARETHQPTEIVLVPDSPLPVKNRRTIIYIESCLKFLYNNIFVRIS